MNGNKQSKRWLITFIVIAIAALIVAIFSAIKKEYLIFTCMAIVFVAQVFNIIKWKKEQ
ncbi:MAG: hypothetical protein PHG06_17235 [Parabacteroides sp.]|nr:hypothetical protein [Parabacteroides sp.]